MDRHGHATDEMGDYAKWEGWMALARLALQIALLVGAYYLAPVGEVLTGSVQLVRLGGTLALLLILGFITWWVSRRVARQISAPDDAVRMDELVLATVVGVAVFALADLVVATVAPNQFVDLRTKTDALYFALTTLITIGYGDIHAQGQLARALLIVQMLFNVIVVATATRNAVRAAGRRLR
jgi:voltage-gated potassium channel